MDTGPTITEFFKRFPDDNACLDYLMKHRHGEVLECEKCGKEGRWTRLKKMPAYACSWCGHHIHPMVGTPFHRSHVPLQKWFYAIYLFTTSRHGVPAKELQRQLGVSYPTAFRMAHKIREYMAKVDGEPPLADGHVEVDETFIGGKKPGAKGRSPSNKTVVFGISERGGEIYTKVVPNASQRSLIPEILRQVPRGSRVSSDQWQSYRNLTALGYFHLTVNHSRDEWVVGDTHVNTLEAFWGMLKRSIRGTHIHVSRKHLPKYLGEFEYRWNMRRAPEKMFSKLLSAL